MIDALLDEHGQIDQDRVVDMYEAWTVDCASFEEIAAAQGITPADVAKVFDMFGLTRAGGRRRARHG